MTCPTAGSIYSADLGHQKHEAAFFQLATRRLGGDPSDVVFVDDLLHNVEQASSAGWRAVHAPPCETWEPTVAELLERRSFIDRLDAALRVLRC